MTRLILSALVLTCGAARASEPLYTSLVPLGDDVECEKCEGYLLPGQRVQRDDHVYAIHSDLPEIFHTPGVLYSTHPVLPPFETHRDGPLGEEMRTQRNNGFTAVDEHFEVFVYHLSEPGGGKAPRRILVLVENQAESAEAAMLEMKWAFEGAGRMGAEDGPETRLAMRVARNDFPVSNSLTIVPGDVAVAAWTPLVAATREDDDATRSAFITGIVRGRVGTQSGAKPRLQVAVVAIPADTPREAWQSTAVALRATGAKSGETAMDLRIPPPPCHLRRVVGVYRNFFWRGGGRFDVTALPQDEVRFQMALPAAQATGCEAAVQTGPMLLHPPYVHPETIGNYTIDHELEFRLHNPGSEPRAVDLRFGKQDASVGLVWQTAIGAPEMVGDDFTAPISGWAGAWTKSDLPDNTLSFLTAGPLTLAPGEEKQVTIRATIIGTSSLPFQIHLVSNIAASTTP